MKKHSLKVDEYTESQYVKHYSIEEVVEFFSTQTKESRLIDVESDYFFNFFLKSNLYSRVVDWNIIKNKHLVYSILNKIELLIPEKGKDSNQITLYPKDLNENLFFIIKGNACMYKIHPKEVIMKPSEFKIILLNLQKEKKWFEIENILMYNKSLFRNITNPMITLSNSFYDMRSSNKEIRYNTLVSTFEKSIKDLDNLIMPNEIKKYDVLIVDSKENDKYEKFIINEYIKLCEVPEYNNIGNSFNDNNLFNNIIATFSDNALLIQISHQNFKKRIGFDIGKLYTSEASFILNNFIFRFLEKEMFIKRYFPFLIYKNYNKGEFIFRKYDNINEILFLSQGELMLFVKLSLSDIVSMRNKLLKKIKFNSNYKEISEETLTNSLKRTGKLNLLNKILTFSIQISKNIDMFGLFEYFTNSNYIFDAKVTSSSANIYKIPVSLIKENPFDLNNEKISSYIKAKKKFLIERIESVIENYLSKVSLIENPKIKLSNINISAIKLNYEFKDSNIIEDNKFNSITTASNRYPNTNRLLPSLKNKPKFNSIDFINSPLDSIKDLKISSPMKTNKLKNSICFKKQQTIEDSIINIINSKSSNQVHKEYHVSSNKSTEIYNVKSKIVKGKETYKKKKISFYQNIVSSKSPNEKCNNLQLLINNFN